ncbi:hypothetical protein M758_3G057900 [Ceratodon purpureus]|nr:hypothetical protein M758_3G057900 [Ceratodon purpureus]
MLCHLQELVRSVHAAFLERRRPYAGIECGSNGYLTRLRRIGAVSGSVGEGIKEVGLPAQGPTQDGVEAAVKSGFGSEPFTTMRPMYRML